MKFASKLARIDRPFNADILRRAREIAAQYRIVIRFVDGSYFGQALELPSAMSDGKTPAECVKNTIDIIATTVAFLIESGDVPPLPASDQKREEQVNVRLSKLEKLTFEEAARSRGFRGVSDFMRAATLGYMNPR